MPIPKLLSPTRVGGLQLAHRVVLAPLTRYRANTAHVHGDLAVTYYGQRASTPGSLLITEATFIAAEAGGYKNVPGIWNTDQINAWKRVSEDIFNRPKRLSITGTNTLDTHDDGPRLQTQSMPRIHLYFSNFGR